MKNFFIIGLLFSFALMSQSSIMEASVSAVPTNDGTVIKNTPRSPTTNIFREDFKLIVCDGPVLPQSVWEQQPNKDTYVPCDFSGIMLQVKHIISIITQFAVILAIISFSYAGYLYITGIPEKINLAKSIFKKTGIGFILILAAWFIVYQLVSWLVPDPGLRTLLGS